MAVLMGLLFLSLVANLLSLTVVWTKNQLDPMDTDRSFVVLDRRHLRSLNVDNNISPSRTTVNSVPGMSVVYWVLLAGQVAQIPKCVAHGETDNR